MLHRGNHLQTSHFPWLICVTVDDQRVCLWHSSLGHNSRKSGTVTSIETTTYCTDKSWMSNFTIKLTSPWCWILQLTSSWCWFLQVADVVCFKFQTFFNIFFNVFVLMSLRPYPAGQCCDIQARTWRMSNVTLTKRFLGFHHQSMSKWMKFGGLLAFGCSLVSTENLGLFERTDWPPLPERIFLGLQESSKQCDHYAIAIQWLGGS